GFQLAPRMVAVNPQTVAEHDKWLLTFDHDAFKADVGALGKRLDKEQGEADVKHLKKICLWSNTCAVLGLATMWLPLGSAANLFSILMLSLVATLLTTKARRACCQHGLRIAPGLLCAQSLSFLLRCDPPVIETDSHPRAVDDVALDHDRAPHGSRWLQQG
ncbi:MAG: hypothetical protein ACPIOQ_44575, partial [Promethearchaeia archaeon]